MTTTQDYEPNMVLATQTFNVVGTRPVRHDGADKVTGRALYGADFGTAGLLHGKILRSPHAHARIKSIDTSAAEALPGVAAVVTNADFQSDADAMVDLGEGATSLKWLRDNVLASDKALYKGHAIAGVAAANAHVAEEAVELIEVEYEVLPPVVTVEDAMAAGAPILHDDLKTEELGEQTDTVSNVAQHFQHKKGDTAAGFAEADVIVEREYRAKTVHQGYIEPHNATALWNTDGRLHIWCSTQGAFTVRDAMAQLLEMPVSQIRVTPMEIGGGFGGKIPVYLEPVAALLSRKTGNAVKILMSRADTFEASGPTCGSWSRVKIGATNDGAITAAEVELAFEAGAYPGSPVGAGAMCALAAYDIENGTVDGYDVVVNKPKTAAYRAPGAPNAAFAVEQAVDELAEKIGMDPLDIRMKNAAKEGTRRVDGPTFNRVGLVETLEAMKSHPHYSAPLGENQGRGVAIGFWFNIGFDSAVNLAVNADGTVALTEGSTDIGGSRASIAMQAAEVLGIPAEDIRPSVVDTDSIGYTAVTGGSRTTFATGWAAYEAAQSVKAQMIERAASIWDVEVDSVQMDGGVISSKSDPELSMTFADLAGPARTHGRRRHRHRVGKPHRSRRLVRRQHRGRRGRPGDGQDRRSALHRRSGRRQGDTPVLRRRADAGRFGAGHRLGAERGVLHERRRRHGQLHASRLPDADELGLADDRHRNRRSRQPRPPVRRSRRRRGEHRPADPRHSQRPTRRHRPAPLRNAHELRRHSSRHRRQRQLGA